MEVKGTGNEATLKLRTPGDVLGEADGWNVQRFKGSTASADGMVDGEGRGEALRCVNCGEDL